MNEASEATMKCEAVEDKFNEIEDKIGDLIINYQKSEEFKKAKFSHKIQELL